MKTTSTTVREFWNQVKAGGDQCHEWPGFRNAHGYGECRDQRFATHLAHRISYLMFKSELAPGEVVDHLCRNRACCNPKHLEAVTQKVNVVRSASRRTTCPHGHPFDAENTQIRSDGSRSCKACKSIYDRERYRKRITS